MSLSRLRLNNMVRDIFQIHAARIARFRRKLLNPRPCVNMRRSGILFDSTVAEQKISRQHDFIELGFELLFLSSNVRKFSPLLIVGDALDLFFHQIAQRELNLAPRHINIEVFMLDDNPVLVEFANQMIKINGGRSILCMPDELGRLIMVEEIKRRGGKI